MRATTPTSPKYNWRLRRVMRRIADSGLSTDTTRDHDYTDWAAVDLFVRKFVHPMERRASSGYATCLHAR
jgi:menaquinone-dependent protoporphyrinogen IX oxidase